MPAELEDPGDNWFRPLKNGGLEVSLRTADADGKRGLKLRASGAEADVWQLVERFEELVGAEVSGDWKRPPRTGPRVQEGQLDLTQQLESGDDDSDTPFEP